MPYADIKMLPIVVPRPLPIEYREESKLLEDKNHTSFEVPAPKTADARIPFKLASMPGGAASAQ